MASFQYQLNVVLPLGNSSFSKVAEQLEISLLCMNCKRNHRTVIFKGLDQDGICTPKNKCSGFYGRLKQRNIVISINQVKLYYTIELEYEPFIDQKYQTESSFEPLWARLYFYLICPTCHKERRISTQGNLGRPRRVKCTCDTIIYQEEHNPFSFKLLES